MVQAERSSYHEQIRGAAARGTTYCPMRPTVRTLRFALALAAATAGTAAAQATQVHGILHGRATLMPAPLGTALGPSSGSSGAGNVDLRLAGDSVVVWAPGASAVQVLFAEFDVSAPQTAGEPALAANTDSCQRGHDADEGFVTCVMPTDFATRPRGRVAVALYYGFDGSV